MMNPPTPLDDANNLIVQRLIRQYLFGSDKSVLTIEGACVTARRIGNRYGVPRDAITYLYEIAHPDLGFVFDFRSVQRAGSLMEPIAVHTAILDYEDVTGQHENDYAVRLAVNGWLQTVPL